jgi:hypothetical protein
MEIYRLLKMLKKKFPDDYVSIDVNCAIHRNSEELEIQYHVYTSSGISKYFNSLLLTTKYICRLTETLTVNEVLNQGEYDLTVE